MTTMAEVAARAGVSTATVSRALGGKRVSREVEAAVRQAAEELDYSLDRTARSLRRRYSDVLALVVPDVENPFFTSVARGVEDVAREAGLSVVLCNSDDDPAKEARYVEIAAQEQMAGLILAPASSRPKLTPLLRKNRTIVIVDREVDEALDQVVFDNVALGRAATEQLIAQGYRRVACITGPEEINTARQRAQGWARAMEDAGLPAPAPLLRLANYRVDGGRAAMRELLSLPQPPDAVVATNNMVGIGVLQALSVHGGPPRPQVSVIGDLPFITADVPGAMALPLLPRDMGTKAALMFVERLGGLSDEPRLVTLDGLTPEPLTDSLLRGTPR